MTFKSEKPHSSIRQGDYVDASAQSIERKRATRKSKCDVSMLDARQKLLYSAKFDYVTLQTNGKVKLPALSGSAKWSARSHYRMVTIHDATPDDLVTLRRELGDLRIYELEIAVDIRILAMGNNSSSQALESLMVHQIAKQLDPSHAPGMKGCARTFYRRLDGRYIVQPFNKRLPRATDQQLHGWRGDAVQVKSYLKRRDLGAALDANQHSARIEVRLGLTGLDLHAIATLSDLLNFPIRRRLMPYFRHVSGVVASASRGKAPSSQLLAVMRAKTLEYDREDFDKVGVGAFLAGGARSSSNSRLARNIGVNDRIGQALHRLQEQCRKANSCV